MGNTSSFVKDSNHFINEIKHIKLDQDDILVIFDVKALYTNIPIDEAMDVVHKITDPNTAKLVEICLKPTFFSFKDEIYEQTCGVAMGSPLSPSIANLFMEHFETKAIESSPLKPKLWKRFVDDTYVIWPHGKENLNKFLEHLNSQSNSIKFMMEVEENGCLPFLDILIKRNQDGTISHQVYRKKTHTEHYLHANSHHHPAQKLGVLNTLATRAIRISYHDNFEQEKNHLLNVFKKNGCKRHQGINVFKKVENPINKQHRDDYVSTIHLPYILGTTDKISHILKKTT